MTLIELNETETPEQTLVRLARVLDDPSTAYPVRIYDPGNMFGNYTTDCATISELAEYTEGWALVTHATSEQKPD
jgi:hypothetical protein